MSSASHRQTALSTAARISRLRREIFLMHSQNLDLIRATMIWEEWAEESINQITELLGDDSSTGDEYSEILGESDVSSETESSSESESEDEDFSTSMPALGGLSKKQKKGIKASTVDHTTSDEPVVHFKRNSVVQVVPAVQIRGYEPRRIGNFARRHAENVYTPIKVPATSQHSDSPPTDTKRVKIPLPQVPVVVPNKQNSPVSPVIRSGYAPDYPVHKLPIYFSDSSSSRLPFHPQTISDHSEPLFLFSGAPRVAKERYIIPPALDILIREYQDNKV